MSTGTIWLQPGPVGTPLPDGWSDLVAHGEESWQWRLLDRDTRQLVGMLSPAATDDDQEPVGPGVTGGSLDYDVAAQTRGTGTVSWSGRAEDQPSWRHVLIQPVFSLTSPTGAVWSRPMGVYLPSTPTVRHSDGGWVSVDVGLYDLTLRLRQRALAYEPYVVPAGGDPLVAFVREMIGYGLGPGAHAIEDDTAKARTPMVFMPGDEVESTYLHVVNSLLDAAGFWAVWADGEGILRSSRYVRPQDRPEVWHFTDGDLADYAPDVEVTDDWFDRPNHILAYSQATGDDEPLEAEAVDLADVADRGWHDRVVSGIDAADQATLQSHADALLAAARSSATVVLHHLPAPVQPNDRVSFTHATLGELPGVVRTMSIDCTPGALWRTTLRQVVA